MFKSSFDTKPKHTVHLSEVNLTRCHVSSDGCVSKLKHRHTARSLNSAQMSCSFASACMPSYLCFRPSVKFDICCNIFDHETKWGTQYFGLTSHWIVRFSYSCSRICTCPGWLADTPVLFVICLFFIFKKWKIYKSDCFGLACSAWSWHNPVFPFLCY